MVGPGLDRAPARPEPASGVPLVDPRQGDIEDDAASPGQKSLLAIAGRMLVEISLPKLLFAWTMSLLLPAALLGLAPLVATAWLSTLSTHVAALTEIGLSAAKKIRQDLHEPFAIRLSGDDFAGFWRCGLRLAVLLQWGQPKRPGFALIDFGVKQRHCVRRSDSQCRAASWLDCQKRIAAR